MKIYKINYFFNFIGGNSDSSEFIKKNYAYTYGELTYNGLESILNSINCKDKVFFDLGSGKGNVVINSIKIKPSLKKSIGIELSKKRYEEAFKNLNSLINNEKFKIQFLNNDILSNDINLNDADIIYISNLCFSDDVNRQIAHKLDNEIKSGTLIFCSKKLPLTLKHEMKVTSVEQSWNEDSNLNCYKIL